jgi:cell division protein FtsZ
MTIAEAQHAAELVTSRISPNARMIWGCTVDPAIEKEVQVLLVLTGVKSPQILGIEEKASGFDTVR